MNPLDPVAFLPPPAAVSAPGVERRGGSGQWTAEGQAAIRKRADEFESMLVQMLVKELREGGLEEGFFGGGVEGDVYGWMMDQHLSQALGAGMPLGLAEDLVRQLQGGAEIVGDPEEAEKLRKLAPVPVPNPYSNRLSTTMSGNETVRIQDPAHAADKKEGPPLPAAPDMGQGDEP